MRNLQELMMGDYWGKEPKLKKGKKREKSKSSGI